ncbi:hypothetical protein [Mesorhizobium humile]|uniref:Sel1 repeat family protein n=1 Tax=Mesorhizobium humile TaxID=3072313 RepID=A0ABU4YK30_9HYPH|nr:MULTISPECIES: hypothetical protein [unclassified Mesorhizobium]MDX8457263.1 hypothetical protein [Mesorhizobium sp. VK2D]MDX8487056.1 hypothetical protein [Mesorhizobium sp. VK2B]
MTQVPLKVVEDESQLFGHALLVFAQDLGSSKRLRLAITRKSADTPYLGDDGWQARPASVAAEVVNRTQGSTTLSIGPEVCDRIPVDLQVKVEVEGQNVWGNAFWPPVTPQPGGWSKELTPPPPPSPRLPERIIDLPEPPVSPPPIRVPEPVATEPRSRSRHLYVLIPLLLLLATAGTYAGYRLGWMDAWLTRPETLAARFERLKRTDADGHELLALSGEAYRQGDAGIGMQAINLAMERGNKDAKLQIARNYDPNSFDPSKADRPDANKAARFYFELVVEGKSEAAGLLRSLCDKNASSPQDPAFNGFLTNTYCEGTLE